MTVDLNPPKRSFTELYALFIVAFIIRVVLILTRFDLRGVPTLSAEYGCIASSIASGRGFASPLCDGGGLTAYEPPVYAYFLAGIFKLWGVFSYKSSVAIALSNAPFTAVIAALIYRIGQSTFGLRTARLAAWLWAVLPLFAVLILHTGWSTFAIWDTWLSAMLVGFAILVSLRTAETGRLMHWTVLAVIWAFMALTNPSLLSFLPVCLLWIAYQLRGQRRFLRGLLVFTVCLMALVAPWVVRNYLVFRRPVFIRDNFGLILYAGNYPGSAGMALPERFAFFNPSERVDFYRLGEVDFDADRLRKAEAFIRNDPHAFVRLSVKRVFYFWSSPTTLADPGSHYALKVFVLLGSSVVAWLGLGIALIRRIHGAFFFAGLLIVYPLIYYFTYSFPRFREVIDPELLLLAVFGITAMIGTFSRVTRQTR
jgi:hypothetical protein